MNYLIQSNSNELIKEELKKIIKDDDNVMTWNYEAAGLDNILEEASYLSFFEEQKYMIIKNAVIFGDGKISETDTEKLVAYLKKPNEKTTIIFVIQTKADMRKKITKTIKEEGKLLVLDGLKPLEIKKKVKELCKASGYDIEDQTIEMIASRCQNNYDLMANEIRKIMLYYNKPQKVQHADALEIVSRSAEDNNFRFIEAMMKKDTVFARKIYQDLMLMKVEPMALLSLLAREYRLTLYTKLMLQQNRNTHLIASLLKLQDWQVEKLIKQSYQFTEEELEGKIHTLLDMDYKIKTGKLDRKFGLELFILGI